MYQMLFDEKKFGLKNKKANLLELGQINELSQRNRAQSKEDDDLDPEYRRELEHEV